MSITSFLRFRFFFLFLGMIFITSCTGDDSGSELISCHKSVLEGEWDVVNKSITYYETQDSIVESSSSYTIYFFEDGTGNREGGTGSFTWSLQCNPDVILINRLGGNSIEENPTFYSAFSELLSITNITNREIHMFVEYQLGSGATKRLQQISRVYTKVE